MPILRSLEYKAWVDHRTLDATTQIDRNRCPNSIAFVLQQLNHMVRVEELFRARLLKQAEPHASTNTIELPTLEELADRLSASNDWLLNYAACLTATQLHERINFTFVDGQKGVLTREEVLFHLVNHGTYHRGAIGRELDLAGASRPADTYTVFIHAIEPNRREA